MNQEYASINSESPREPQGYPQVHPPQAQQVFMPVYTQSQATQQAPQGIQRTMPAAPQRTCNWAANLTLEQCQEAMIKSKKRVKCTSRTLMLFGVLGLGVSIWQSYTARKVALNVIQGRRAFGPPEPPIENDYGKVDHEAMKQRFAELGAQTITRDEIAVYDIVKTISFLFFLLSVVSFGLGKLGMRTVWREKSQCSNRVSKKSCIGYLFVVIFGMILRHEGTELHQIIMRNKFKKSTSNSIVSIINQTDSLNLTEPIGRNLRSHHRGEGEQSFGDDVEDICNALSNDGCESDERCSWCKSAAVPSVCHSVDMAKALPSAVFSCDNLDASHEEFAGRGHGKWNHHGKDHKDHHKGGKHGHGHHEKPCPVTYGAYIYAFLLIFHMCNLRCYFYKLNAWETKRVEAGEVLSEDGWGCGPWKKKWKKKHEQRRVNQTSSVQDTEGDSQIDSSTTQMQ